MLEKSVKMEPIISEDILAQINNAYINLFVMAIDRKKDLWNAVDYARKVTNSYLEEKNNKFLPKGIEGIVFLSMASRAMELSLFDVIYYSEVEKENAIRKLVDGIEASDINPEQYIYNEAEDIVSFSHIYQICNQQYVKLQFWRKPIEESYGYGIDATFSTDGIKYGFDTDFMYDSAVILTGESCFVADFVESVIELNAVGIDESITDNKEENAEDEAPKPIGHKERCIVEVQKGHEISSDVSEKKIIDELVEYIGTGTKSLSLFDRFEGYGEGKSVYKRIVVANTQKHWDRDLNIDYGYNLVIERSTNGDYVGDITFTNYKLGKDGALREHVTKELAMIDAMPYLDKDVFVRFKQPFHLRAQYTRNRTGYGWEWNWSGRYGSYVEGTQYGETTDYVFVGAYITSYYKNYVPTYRKPFVCTKIENSELGNKDEIMIEASAIIRYEGKLYDKVEYNNHKQYFLTIIDKDGKTKYLPVSYDFEKRKAYMCSAAYDKYRDRIRGSMKIIKNL